MFSRKSLPGVLENQLVSNYHELFATEVFLSVLDNANQYNI